jgi:glycine/sarcosine N-methyltransferase
MAFDVSPASFYDEVADDYHLIFTNWDESVDLQGRFIASLLGGHGLATGAVLDCSCGIGTQAIGLAKAGYAVTATDISPASVQRCAREASARGLLIRTSHADMRSLEGVTGPFDAVISFGNALPHLLDDADLQAAACALRRVVRPGGVLLASIRDYDAALRNRPSGDLPRRFQTDAGERIVFQVWDWGAQDTYTLRYFVLDRTASGWEVAERTTLYRALSRATLTEALAQARFDGIAWQMPEQTGYFEPVVVARADMTT